MDGDDMEQGELRRLLGRREVLALSFGAMVGWGWVVLSREMIERAGTVGSALAFAAGAVVMLLVGLIYAELTSALSRAGGEISFTFVGIGSTASFVCGWALALAYLSVCAFEAVALPTVLSYLFEDFDVGHLYTIAGWDVHLSWIAVGVLGACTLGIINYLGIRMASVVQAAAAGLLLLIGLAFFIPGNIHGDLANLTPAFTGWQGFFGVVIMTPFLFVGFDVIPQVAEEIRIPFRSVGKLILLSIGFAMTWYMLVQWTVGMTLDAAALKQVELATADAMSAVYNSPWGGRILVFGGLLGIVTSWNAFVIGSSRLLFAMSRGGLLPKIFSHLHPKHGTPVAALTMITVLTALAPLLGRQALVWFVDAGGFAAVLGYILVTVSFLRIRKNHPDLPRPYRVPAPRIIGPLAFAATVLFICLYLPGSPSSLSWPYEWAVVIGWTVLGGLFYIACRRRVSEMGHDEQARLILGDYAHRLGKGSDSGSSA
jgi:amino acid transporter